MSTRGGMPLTSLRSGELSDELPCRRLSGVFAPQLEAVRRAKRGQFNRAAASALELSCEKRVVLVERWTSGPDIRPGRLPPPMGIPVYMSRPHVPKGRPDRLTP